MHCAFGSLNTNQVIACIVKLGFLFFSLHVSPDNSYMRILWFCSLLAFLLAELFPSCSSKLLAYFFDCKELASLSPGQIKSKRV